MYTGDKTALVDVSSLKIESSEGESLETSFGSGRSGIPQSGITRTPHVQIPVTTTLNTTIHLTESLFHHDNILGIGAFATVYKYQCPDTNLTVAIKHLHNVDSRKCMADYAKFREEMEVHRTLRHCNILKFLGSGDVGSKVVMIVEFAEMGSLNDVFKRDTFNRKQILNYTHQIVKGLEYLHSFKDDEGKSRPIIHRDLRGANILLMKDDAVKIADFGICKQLEDLAAQSGNVTSVGNAYWKAPEVIQGKKKRERSERVKVDLWSLGVVILEMFYGGSDRVPFINYYEQFQYVFKLGQGFAPKVPEEAPVEVKKVLRCCFEYEARCRKSASQLLCDIFNGMSEEVLMDLEIEEPKTQVESMRSISETTDNDTLTASYDIVEGGEVQDLACTSYAGIGRQFSEDEDPHLTPAFHRKYELLKEYTRSSASSISMPSHVQKHEYQRYWSQMANISKETETLLILSRYHKDQSYVVKKMKPAEMLKDALKYDIKDELLYKVTFDEEGKTLTVKSGDKSIYSICCTAESTTESYMTDSTKGSDEPFAKVTLYNDAKKYVTRKRLKVQEISMENSKLRVMSHESIVSLTSIAFGSKSILIKKHRPGIMGRHSPGSFVYSIRFKCSKQEIGKFNVDTKEEYCRLVSLKGTDTALLTAVTAFYLRQKFAHHSFNFFKISSYKNVFSRSKSYSKI